MGVPSVFLRTFGCNFTCDSFGMPQGQKSNERHLVAKRIADFKSYQDLPLVKSGCDSYASWAPEFKHLSPVLSTDSIAEAICQLLPNKKWMDEHLVITGGEPLLGWQKSYPDLLDHPLMTDLKEITFETNGTQSLSDDFVQYLRQWNQSRWPHGRGGEITFSVSPKLSVSGESWVNAICPAVVCQYQSVGYTYLKFVISSAADAEEALLAIKEFRSFGFTGPVYLMPVGGVEDIYKSHNRTVADLAIKLGLRYSDRLQMIWKNAWGT